MEGFNAIKEVCLVRKTPIPETALRSVSVHFSGLSDDLAGRDGIVLNLDELGLVGPVPF